MNISQQEKEKKMVESNWKYYFHKEHYEIYK